MNAEQRLLDYANNAYQPKVTKVKEHIYHFLGWGHSNAIAIIAKESIILIDTLDSDARAQRMKEYLQGISDKPVKTIIYTHGHPDHMGGSGAFKDTVEEIIAFAPHKPVLKHYDRIQSVLMKRGKFQHGYGLTQEEAICQGIGIREGKEVGDGSYAILPPTTIYHEDFVERCIDGVSIKLVSAVGESDDQLFVWLEDERVLCCGDNYYACFPNIYAIRGTQYRDLATWIDTIDNMLTYPIEALLPGHTHVVLGKDEVQSTLTQFRTALDYILLHTLDCMNKGMSVSETIEAINLPKEVAEAECLQEYYGTIEWSVRSIYQGYVGWFDGNAVNLLPHSDVTYAKAIMDLIGDEEKLIAQIKASLKQEDAQMALQLLQLMELAGSHTTLTTWKKEALLMRSKQVTSANARHYYIASAKELSIE